MVASKLISENKLQQAESGLWHLPDVEVDKNFAYSDGDDEEAYVRDVIAGATDTSSTSAELESHIHDWPSEYHLTSKRAHLLRALDLSGLENVLELGCGCGAISRYLAEQGMQVDAIEGSARRASIAHSRCRDLDNISIVNANFNHIELPENTYDAVFLIGVLEYAKRFCPDAVDDRAAVLEILAAVQKSLKPNGVIITAIENRLGLKYLLGTTEDHYGVPYIGIHNYPDSAGIRTYNLAEWRAILTEAGFDSNTFLAPFPDYKIPTVVLHEDFLQQPQAAEHLRGSVSRDYLRGFSTDFDEYQFWQACNQNRNLLDFSNSYLIIAGIASDTADNIAAYDFAHFTGSQRKQEYRTITRKARGVDTVSKHCLLNDAVAETANGYTHQCKDETYLHGELLSDRWLNTLKIWQDQQKLLSLYKGYYDYLIGYQEDNLHAKDMIDMLPFNIIVDEDGNWHSFDREWCADKPAQIEYILFRALFWFVYENGREFSLLFKQRGWNSIAEYISDCFEELGLTVDNDFTNFAEQEDAFQNAIGTVGEEQLISRLLLTTPTTRGGETMFYPRLYWALPNEACTEQNSIRATAIMGKEHQLITFQIDTALLAGSLLRFDPAEREGYFHIHSVKLVDTRSNKVLLQVNTIEDVVSQFSLFGLSAYTENNKTVFFAHDNDPYLQYHLQAPVESLSIEIEMDWPHSEEYELVRDGLNQQHAKWQKQKAALQQQVEQLKNRLQKEQQLHTDHEELKAIKASRSYRMGRKLAKIIKR
jgi:2-polyprenyl-3-methyl-5-hydroxy-6-metoxy-1,4-benzoquinol methylase